MKVLVCCEESQAVANAFRALGHLAFSSDIKDCTGGHPEYHLKGDCRDFVFADEWDLIIAHPPCTYLSAAGACHLISSGEIKDFQRYEEMLKAREFFMFFYNLPHKRVCIENPRALKLAQLPPYTQIIQPFQFGDDYSKQTLLWLKGLPPLIPLCYTTNKRKSPTSQSWTDINRGSTKRSKTFKGIAEAMARQWGSLDD